MSRSNFLKEQEAIVQKKWGPTFFEANAPMEFDEKNKNKFFATFPFPYTNSCAHLGHVYTMLKADFIARHYRTRGYNVLYPYAFHMTGIPICAAAKSLKEELESGKPGKQYETMIKADIPVSEIPKFVDPVYWTKYFPQLALERDLPALGCSIDYRRSFITTDLNPHFDSFVKWQFNCLNRKGYLRYGKWRVIYSQKDRQPCSDADRSVGEGIEIRELKVAFVTNNNVGYFVTFDGSAPVDSIIKSSNMNLMHYEIDSTNNTKQDVYMSTYFYDNYKSQTETQMKGYQWNSPNNMCNPINGKTLDEFVAKMEICNITHGSGFYTSNPNLEWHSYYETDGEVISRSGDRCIVAETEQWFIDYDKPEWKNAVYQHVESKVKFTDPVVRNMILTTIREAHPWPFSRTYGLGTKIPFDTRYLIDSLSDSTIYMAYYTVAHIVKNLPLDVLSDDVWYSIFLNKDTRVSQEYSDMFKVMRNEFKYWYPLDLRVSGKDLITNHLTMMFFNHMAIFGPELMPRMLYANGHIMINGKKMSKSLGNFITLNQAVERYGVDVTRFICANIGDDTMDSSFYEKDVDSSTLSLYAEIQNWSKIDFEKMRRGKLEFYDQLHLVSLNKILALVEKAYSEMRFRDVAKIGFYEIQNVRNKYINPHYDVFRKFMQAELAMVCPFIPHWAEYMSTTFEVPTIWPKIDVDAQYNNAKTEWLCMYCEIIKPKIASKIATKVKKQIPGKFCRLTINNAIDKYLEKIANCDTKNKENRKDILKLFSNKTDTNTVIELITHLDKYDNLYARNDMTEWLRNDHGLIIKSYFEIFYPQYEFQVVYTNSGTSDPLNPIVEFYESTDSLK